MAKADVVRFIEDEDPTKPCIIFFKRSAELTYVQTASFKAEQVLAAMPLGSSGCGCAPRGAVARQNDGGGPTVDLCEWACMERYRLCEVNGSRWQKFWCAVGYFWCRLGCSTGPIIV